jgi:hypothetical protein
VQSLATLQDTPGITTRCADLEGAPWPYTHESFDGIIVTNYLHRPLFDALIAALAPNGALIYETFMAGNEQLGKPSNPDFLLTRNELLERLHTRLTIVAFEQGRVDTPKPAVIQRVCAVRAISSSLPP